MENWISADERLPDKAGLYLICTENGYIQTLKYGTHYTGGGNIKCFGWGATVS